jgi:transcription initiation factor TFIIE subunit alpha
MKKDAFLISLIKEVVRKTAGKGTEELVDLMFLKKNVNEFKIADKLKKNINEVRNLLYKLSSYNIITSTRKKDRRKGWYTYFWTIDNQKALETLLKFKEQEIYAWEHILKSRETKQFYSCESDSIEMSEETALHHSFSCPECGELLQPISKEKKTKEIIAKIDAAKKETFAIKNKLEENRPKTVKEKEKVKADRKIVKKERARKKRERKRSVSIAKKERARIKRAKIEHKTKPHAKKKKKAKKPKKKVKKKGKKKR